MEMPSYDEYRKMLLDRFSSDTLNRPKKWKIAGNLVRKVSKEGFLQPFYGYTSIFDLSEAASAECRKRYDAFCGKAGSLVIPLPSPSFHLTLHTFWNENNSASPEEVNRRMEVSRPLIRKAMDEIMKKYGDAIINMISPGISTNGRDVVSMKFIPTSEKDYGILCSMFLKMEGICPLGQPYVPHISFSYFKVRDYKREEIDTIYDAIDSINSGFGATEIPIAVSSLGFRMHRMMDGYIKAE